jgi:purine-binding chemotaxis protein CheW
MSESKNEQLFDLDLLSKSEVSDSLLLEKQLAQTVGNKFIVFTLNGLYYAVISNKVSEVVRPLPFTPLPSMPDWFMGISNLRGDIISIIDLKTLWNLKTEDSPKSKFIVLRSENAASFIAFKVDKLREIVTLSDDQIDSVTDENLPYLSGKATHKSNEIHILNIEEILSSLTLKQN